MKDSVLELDTNISYYCIEELERDNKKYVLLALVNLDKDIIDEDNLVVKEVIENSGSIETKDIDDEVLATEVLKDLIIKNKGTN